MSYTGQTVIDEMLELSQSIEEAISDMRDHGIKAAKADRTYRVEKAIKVEELKAEKYPATLCDVVANGYLIVADARCTREIEDALRNASLESLRVMNRKYDLLKEIYSRGL